MSKNEVYAAGGPKKNPTNKTPEGLAREIQSKECHF